MEHMPEVGPKEIRLFCVCGQKMKISAEMFGRKGKCIACRQKLRVPYLDEIPEGETKVYLKEHPEFLRMPYLAAHAAANAKKSGKPQKKKDEYESIIIPGDFIKPVMDSDGEEEESNTQTPESFERLFPLDAYKPLRALCSLEYKAEKQRAEHPESNGELRSMQDRLQLARDKMETKFRERLIQLTEKLAQLQEELLQYNFDLRTGKLNYSEYRSKVRSLRHRREAMARLQHNLRAWLQVHDPYSAGGLVDLPKEALPAAFPLPHPEDAPIPMDIALNSLLMELHDAFKARVTADKKLEDCQRACDGGALAGAELEEARATAMSEKARARARILHSRKRIAEAETDFQRDADALQSNLDLAEEELQEGKITNQAFNALKADLQRGMSDNEQARDLARRALSSNSATDIPVPHGTFFSRLVNTSHVKDLGTDRWLGLAASAALLITSFLPFTPVSNNWAMMPVFSWMLIVTALLVASVALVPKNTIRTFLYTTLWVLVCVGCGFYLHELRFTADALGDIVRADTRWWLRPGMLSLIVSVALLGAASCLAAASSRRKIPYSPLVGVILISAGIALTVTHLGGLLSPVLTITEPELDAVSAYHTAHRVTIPIKNTGRRAVWFVQKSETLPFPVGYSLSRQRQGAPALAQAPLLRPEAVQRPDGAWTAPDAIIPVRPGEKIAFRYRLSPGMYEFALDSDRIAGLPLRQGFTLEGNQSNTTATPPNTNPSAFEPPENANPVTVSLDHIEVQLQGVLNNADGDPVFSLNVLWPDGAQERWRIKLNQPVFGPWRAQEYNPAESTLTFSNGEALRILNKDETLSLELQ